LHGHIPFDYTLSRFDVWEFRVFGNLRGREGIWGYFGGGATKIPPYLPLTPGYTLRAADYLQRRDQRNSRPVYPRQRNPKGTGWYFVPALSLPRRINEVFIEAHVRQALIRLNPSISEKPERTDEVLYKLRTIVLSLPTIR